MCLKSWPLNRMGSLIALASSYAKQSLSEDWPQSLVYSQSSRQSPLVIQNVSAICRPGWFFEVRRAIFPDEYQAIC